MRRLSLLVVLGLVLMSTSLTASEKIVLVARDFDNRPISGLQFAYEGHVSRATNRAGGTELDLPPGLPIGRQIEILLVPSSEPTQEWFLVNYQVNVPGALESASVVLMRRSKFRMIATEVSKSSTAAPRPGQATAEDQKRVSLKSRLAMALPWAN